MLKGKRYAKVNVKVLIILIVITAAIIISLFAARQIRRSVLSKMDLDAGQQAYENKDWPAAYKHFKEYLGRNPDDLEILKKYGEARLSIRPLDIEAVFEAISIYRDVIQKDYFDETAYEKLASLYRSIGNYEELAYIARKRLEHVSDDKKAPLWLADALTNLNQDEEAQKTLLQFSRELEKIPEKQDEYVQACQLMSSIIVKKDSSPQAAEEALKWLKKAVDYAPGSAEAVVNRARFYCESPAISGMTLGDRLAATREDLLKADELGTENPRVRFMAASKWITLGDFEKVSEQIKAIDNLSQETIEKYFFDSKDLEVTRFLLSSEIALRKGEISQAIKLSDESLELLTEERHRIRILPAVVRSYAAAEKEAEARKYLDEYLGILRKQNDTQLNSLENAYLQVLVARGEGKPYLIIDILQSVIANNASVAELWQLLAEAYIQTEQPRRAIAAIENYNKLYPKDTEMIMQLARTYSQMKQWSQAFKNAELAESLMPDDISAKLLRIESGIRIAGENLSNQDKASLEKFSKELADLRLKHPDLISIRMMQASIAEYLGQTETAEKELIQAIADCNDSLNAEMQLANLYKKIKSAPDDAARIYTTACTNHPDSAKPWLSLADLYSGNAKYDLAQDTLKEALNKITDKEDKRSITIKLALLEIIQGIQEKRNEGIQRIKNLAEQDNRDLQARLLLLELREIQQNSEEAEKLIGEIKQIEGQSGLWWRLNQSKLWLSSDQWRSKQQDIADMLQTCISADPSWSTPVLMLVDLYKKLGDTRRVEDTCKQALARNPSASDIANALLLFLEEQGRVSEAEKILQQAGMSKNLLNVWQIRMALSAGDISEAIKQLELRVSNDKKDTISRIQLARLIYQQTKDAGQAFTYLDEALAVSPDSFVVAGTKAGILKTEGRTDEALKILNDYVTAHDNFNAYRLRGMYFANEGVYELAEKDFRKLTTFEDGGINGFAILSEFFAERKQFDKAISAIEEGLAKYPEDLPLERALMKLLAVEGPSRDIDRSKNILKKLEEKLPQDTDIMRFKAALLLENPTSQSIAAAGEILQKIIKLEPTSIDAYLMLISIAAKEKNYDAAREYVIRGLGANSDNPVLMTTRSRIELEAGNFQIAAELANIILKKYPDNTEARDIFIMAAINSQDSRLLKEAGTMVESALVSNPKDEKLLIAKSSISVLMDQAKNAIPDLEAYCQTEPGSSSVSALAALSELYLVTGDLNKSEQKINQAAGIEPNNLSVIYSRFLLLIAQNKFDELSQISTLFISAKSPNTQVLLKAATILISLNSRELKEEGIKLFEYAVSLSPDSLNENFYLASALYSMGNIERAEKIYRNLLEKFPKDVRVLNDFAWILQDNYKDYSKALELADKGLSLAPNNLNLLDTRGTILLKSGNQLDKAKKDFEKLAELAPSGSRQQAKAFLNIGRICIKLSDFAGAKQYFVRAQEINQKLNIFTPAEMEEIKGFIQ
ncbi:MAG: tetratricopeptide repeat protein [Sedimentisphaerales bacterium]|nr:tetratricopeptide repeat protein [Sedimentisphaerales bacterium]